MDSTFDATPMLHCPISKNALLLDNTTHRLTFLKSLSNIVANFSWSLAQRFFGGIFGAHPLLLGILDVAFSGNEGFRFMP